MRTDEIASMRLKATNNTKKTSSFRDTSAEKTKQMRHDMQIKKALYETNKDLSFEPGSLNIVDLSSQHVDPEHACMLFNIVLDVFLQKIGDKGSAIALDEAHKVNALHAECGRGLIGSST